MVEFVTCSETSTTFECTTKSKDILSSLGVPVREAGTSLDMVYRIAVVVMILACYTELLLI